ncbi:NAD(P)/FAD-dependent oxidoreductase [Deinococcus lacus]|uniref:NAD(P)/FAD-dependent oxidoreductase n=1 Tax=Deinococcus lacus TaxID=392561 RepID=A0ABW1YEJ0_9DEIO
MIAVVGGGLIGSAIAFELSQAGADVVVLDAAKPGAAWRAGAGMLSPSGERLAGTLLEPLAAQSLRLWPDFARRLAAASGLAVPWQPGIAPVEYGSGQSSAPATAGEATTHPPSVVRAARSGLDLRRSEVSALEWRRSGVRLHTSQGSLNAERVVLAAGAWSGRFGLPVFLVRGQALLWPDAAPLPARYSRKQRGFPLYGLPRPDGQYTGATARLHCWEAGALPHDSRWLRQAAARLWPEAAPAQPEQMLVGLRPCTPDGLPITGPLAGWAGRVWAATGHGRHGALLAPLTARHLAEELL